ncbi:VWA domain-containing protein [Siminovitchia sediminis]|uniref:VWA domain-containing protein n=1 Tax=Siminovitchia sediminis TaxID=1274353 RepID=A0ABW4KGR6_9BACI
MIGPQETMDSIRAAESVHIFDKEQFKTALRLVLCSRKEDQPIFDYAFKEVFSNTKENRTSDNLLHYLTDEGNKAKPTKETTEQRNPQEEKEKEKSHKNKQPLAASIPGKNTSGGETGGGEKRKVSWFASNTILKQADEFQAFIPHDELEVMKQAAKMLVKKISLTRGHTYQTAKKGTRPDIRKTMRDSLQTGGYPVHLYWKNRKRHSAKFVLLCDASRSMSIYAQRFLQFAYALSTCTKHVEVFLFSTKIKRVTEQLLERRADLPVLNQLGDSWGGGTCIGESIYSFVRDNGPQMLHRDTVVLIASDGLDAGDISHMAWSMREIHKRTAAVLWLNPLLAIEGYEPTARGMKAALPFIDLFIEASDAQSFMRLAKKVKIRR